VSTQTVDLVAVEEIVADTSTQWRVAHDEKAIADMLATLRDGGTLPPLDLFDDGRRKYVGDGHHRLAAWRAYEASLVPARIHKGDADAAFLFGVRQGVGNRCVRARRDDMKNAAVEMFSRPGIKFSLRVIATELGVSHMTVKRWLPTEDASCNNVTTEGDRNSQQRRGSDGKTYNANKNRKPRVERDPEPVVDEPAVEETPEVFDAPAPDDVPAFVVDEPVAEPEPPPVVAAPPAPVRVAPVEPPVAVVVPLVAMAPAPVVSVPTHDARGTEIPEALRATYAAMTRRAERIARAAEALRAEFEELKNDLPAWRAETGRTAIATPGLPGLAHCMNQELPGLLYAARQFAPQYLCEDCSGRDPACKHCEGAGWEPEGRVRERLRQQKAVATARAKAGVR